jgi:arylsulfatase A-like enzyme
VLLAAAIVAAGLTGGSPVRVSAPRPNILVIVLDDVGYADLESVPHPSLDVLADQGIWFDAAYANATCSPSRRSLLFGRYFAGESGVPCFPPDGQEPSLAEISLAEALAYPTSALLGKWHVGGNPTGGPWELAPQAHSFGHWLAGSPTNLQSEDCPSAGYHDWLRVDDGASARSATYEPKDVRDAFLLGWPGTVGPKFGLVAHSLAHIPLHVPPADLLPLGWPRPVSKREKYEAMIVALDTLVGQMLKVVDLRTTLVIVVGDNGTPPGVAPDPSRAKGTTFERGVRVPFIVAGVGVVAPGRFSHDLVHLVDLYATLVELYGGGQPSDGESLAATLANQPRPPRGPMILGASGEIAARGGDLKLRRLAGAPEELYDLAADPEETNDVLGRADLAFEEAELRALLDAFASR